MAANAAATGFRNALTRIGINAATRAAIVENGFVTVIDLVSVQDKDLDKLPKHLEAWKVPDAFRSCHLPNSRQCAIGSLHSVHQKVVLIELIYL